MNATISVKTNFYRVSLFRAYADAKGSGFECAVYECRDREGISDYIQNLGDKTHFDCYYNPTNTNHAYAETGDKTKILTIFILLIIFTVLGGLFDIMLILFLLCQKCGLLDCESSKNSHTNMIKDTKMLKDM